MNHFNNTLPAGVKKTNGAAKRENIFIKIAQHQRPLQKLEFSYKFKYHFQCLPTRHKDIHPEKSSLICPNLSSNAATRVTFSRVRIISNVEVMVQNTKGSREDHVFARIL